jgi:hypothetical protein
MTGYLQLKNYSLLGIVTTKVMLQNWTSHITILCTYCYHIVTIL